MNMREPNAPRNGAGMILLSCAGRGLTVLGLVLLIAAGTSEGEVIQAYLNGGGQVPPNGSPHTGYGGFFFVAGSTQIQATVICPPPFEPLSAAIHGPATPNDTAPLLVDLGSFSAITNILVLITWSNGLVTNWLTNISMISSNTVSLSAEEMEDFESGRYYLNLTSEDYPDGEIRGHIVNSAVLARPRLLQTTGFSFQATGPLPSRGYEVDVSTNLMNWTTLSNRIISTNHIYTATFFDPYWKRPGISMEIVDPADSDDNNRFYRVRER